MHTVVVIGCGTIGERHLRAFQRTGRARVVACDSNPALLESLATKYGVSIVTDWQRVLAERKFDVAVICTPCDLHVSMATQAVRQGLHVLIEKPLAPSLTGVDALLQARDEGRRQVAVGYVWHVFPCLVQARDYLLGGELGPVRHVTAVSGQNFPRLRPAHTAHYSQTYYRDQRTGGGAIQDALTHLINWVEHVIGPADSVLCDCAHQVLPEVTVEDTVNLSSRHGDVLAGFSLNQFQAPNESTLQFNAVSGSLKIELHRERWGVFRENDTDWQWRTAAVPDRDAHFLKQANVFLDQVEGEPAQLCSLEAAGQTLRFNLAALASAQSGARVHCAEVYA